VNGLLKSDNSPAFPNAEILAPAGDTSSDGRREMSRAPKGRMEGLFKNIAGCSQAR